MAFLRLTLLTLVLFSCFDNGPGPISKAELIAGTSEFGKTYQIERIEIDLGTVTPHKCVTDNFITYYPNGTYEINEGATKCDPTDPPGIMGVWYMDDSETQLHVEIDNSRQVWTIEDSSSDQHQISSFFRDGRRLYTLTLSK
ncbi:hypothetical protein [Ekhidna sp.]|uniref:hypothetical protein n=1 Tax=Ekhidna sp. TaxID=2608089 RepID=UPI003513E12F